MKNLILGLLCVASLVFIIGSVGAWDNGSIGFGRLLIQVAIGGIIEWISLSNIDM